MKSVEARGYIPRFMADPVLEAMREARVVALLGPRQSGKSTLARRLAVEHLNADYLTLDDATVLSLANQDPVGFLSGLGSTVIIDEIQRAPDLLLAIKTKVDQNERPGQFLITGSANLRSLPTVADSLPGRVEYLSLLPFSQGEIRRKQESFLDDLFDGIPPAVSRAPVGRGAYSELLIRGGYPEAQRRSFPALDRFFNSYVQSIVDRDVPETAKVHDPSAVASLLRLVAARSGSIARYETLGRDIGLDGKTAKSYLEVLDRLFLIRIRRPWHRNLGKRQVKAPKLYVADTGLLAGLIGIDKRRLETDGGVAGSVFETFVATELERQATWNREPPSFWHLRDGEREVDVVAERRSGEIVGIEVKASATVKARDFKGLEWLRDKSGPEMKSGVVLYLGDQTLPFGDRLWAVPLHALWR